MAWQGFEARPQAAPLGAMLGGFNAGVEQGTAANQRQQGLDLYQQQFAAQKLQQQQAQEETELGHAFTAASLEPEHADLLLNLIDEKRAQRGAPPMSPAVKKYLKNMSAENAEFLPQLRRNMGLGTGILTGQNLDAIGSGLGALNQVTVARDASEEPDTRGPGAAPSAVAPSGPPPGGPAQQPGPAGALPGGQPPQDPVLTYRAQQLRDVDARLRELEARWGAVSTMAARSPANKDALARAQTDLQAQATALRAERAELSKPVVLPWNSSAATPGGWLRPPAGPSVTDMPIPPPRLVPGGVIQFLPDPSKPGGLASSFHPLSVEDHLAAATAYAKDHPQDEQAAAVLAQSRTAWNARLAAEGEAKARELNDWLANPAHQALVKGLSPEAARDTARAEIDKRKVTTRVDIMTPKLGEDALNRQADFVNQGGVLQSRGLGPKMIGQILDRAAERAKETGGEMGLALLQGSLKANNTEMTRLQTIRGPLVASMRTASDHLARAEQLSGTVARSDIQALNRFLLAGEINWLGDPKAAAFAGVMRIATTEVARAITTMSGGGGQPVSDAARKDIEDVVRPAMATGQISEVIAALRGLMLDKRTNFDAQIRETQDRIKRLGSHTPPQAPRPGAQGAFSP